MHIMHKQDDKASTDFVHAPRCGLHAICVAVVITFIDGLTALQMQSNANLCETYFIACNVM